jgi:hypothetical protein
MYILREVGKMWKFLDKVFEALETIERITSGNDTRE